LVHIIFVQKRGIRELLVLLENADVSLQLIDQLNSDRVVFGDLDGILG
jgi:hypothetical protein